MITESYLSKKLKFSSDNLNLAGTLVCPSEQVTPGVLFVHGASENGLGRVTFSNWQKLLAGNNISSFAFDARGVGDSEPQDGFYQSTLANRLKDTEAAYKYFIENTNVDPGRIAIVGNSMGGHIVAKFAGSHPELRAVILKNCAAYSGEAEDKLMKKSGEKSSEFSNVIRTPNSWKNSPAFEALAKFKGAVMVVHSELDKVITKDVQDYWINSVTGQLEYMELKNVGHLYMNREDVDSLAAELKLYNGSTNFLRKYLI